MNGLKSFYLKKEGKGNTISMYVLLFIREMVESIQARDKRFFSRRQLYDCDFFALLDIYLP